MGEVVEWLNDREGRAPGGGGGGLGLGLGLDGDGGEWGKIEGPGGVGSKTERLRNVSGISLLPFVSFSRSIFV